MKRLEWTKREIADFDAAVAHHKAIRLEILYLRREGCADTLIAEIFGITEEAVRATIGRQLRDEEGSS